MQKDLDRKTDLSAFMERRLKFALRRLACSETWVEDQIRTVADVDRNGVAGVRRRYVAGLFPPGGRLGTRMRWCRCCFRYTPPGAMSLVETRLRRTGEFLWATLVCDDCRIPAEMELHRELYEALSHLRPAGSQSVVGLRNGRTER